MNENKNIEIGKYYRFKGRNNYGKIIEILNNNEVGVYLFNNKKGTDAYIRKNIDEIVFEENGPSLLLSFSLLAIAIILAILFL